MFSIFDELSWTYLCKDSFGLQKSLRLKGSEEEHKYAAKNFSSKWKLDSVATRSLSLFSSVKKLSGLKRMNRLSLGNMSAGKCWVWCGVFVVVVCGGFVCFFCLCLFVCFFPMWSVPGKAVTQKPEVYSKHSESPFKVDVLPLSLSCFPGHLSVCFKIAALKFENFPLPCSSSFFHSSMPGGLVFPLL